MPIESFSAFLLLVLLIWLVIYATDIAMKLDRQSSIALIVIALTLLMTIGSVAVTLHHLGSLSNTKNLSAKTMFSLTHRDICWLPKNK